MSAADILMITFNAPDYVRLSLPRVLDACGENDRVWIWQNGDHEEMVETAHEFAKDPRVHRFHHSRENVRLTQPTNWMWSEGRGDFVSKVDDDCLLPVDWISRLRQAHESANNEKFGAIGCSRLRPEDQDHELIAKRLISYDGDVTLFRSNSVQGSGYLMPRRWIDGWGLLQTGQSWTMYCVQLAHAGALHGFLHPFLFEDHMDDPRSEHTLLHSDADLAWRMPLSAKRSKVVTLEDWQNRLLLSAKEVQVAKLDLKYHRGWRRKATNLKHRVAMRRRP